MRIGTLDVGPNADILLVAEVGLAHDGNCNVAHAFIDAVARTGATVIKFQTHIAEAESTAREPFRAKFSHLDNTRLDYWRRTGFTEEQWRGLKQHAEEAGLVFMSSPFSIEAVDLLERIGVEAWKVGSGETNNRPMLERIAQTGKPIIVSTGMSREAEIGAVVALIRKRGNDLALLHCTSMYPSPPEQTGLNVLAEFRDRYGCPVGLSDHSGEIYAALAAAALGADIIEVHVCMSNDCFGPDVPASLTVDELATLADGLAKIRTMITHPVDKQAMAETLEPMRRIFCKSIVYCNDIPSGSVLEPEHLTGKKPGDGIPITEVDRYVGRRLLRNVSRDEPLAVEDVE